MDMQDAALVAAGVTGGGVAVVHGLLTQRLMVRPIAALLLADKRIGAPIRRLVPVLLHYSTVSWLLGGLALIVAAIWFEPQPKLATSLFVGSLYLFAALGNFWGTRGRHPGWFLYAVTLVLIGFGLTGFGL